MSQLLNKSLEVQEVATDPMRPVWSHLEVLSFCSLVLTANQAYRSSCWIEGAKLS